MQYIIIIIYYKVEKNMKKIIVLLLILSSISSCALWQNRKTNIINKELILISKDDTK